MAKTIVILTCVLTAIAAGPEQNLARGYARQAVASVDPAEEALRAFLREYLDESPDQRDIRTSYSFGLVDLNGDQMAEVVVHIESSQLCGSGGCTTLILQKDGFTYRVIGRTAITRPPIRVLHTMTNGWKDISVWVRGGGIQKGYEAILPFDGTMYPRNPSVRPAGRLHRKTAGEVIIPIGATSTPLYQ